MSRPRCFICFKQLMYVAGKPVWDTYTVDGVEHKVHKSCLRKEQADVADQRLKELRLAQQPTNLAEGE